MLIFPIQPLLDEQACYDWLLHTLHPDGLCCPNRHPLPQGQKPHDRHRAPVMDYRCHTCGAVYNLFTDTVLKRVRRKESIAPQCVLCLVREKHALSQTCTSRIFPKLSRRHSCAAFEDSG
jgi:transposase-like protein